MRADNLSNQLRWVILLLAAAVILPTVCLLWFMNQAVKNERLAVRQKLIDAYQPKLDKFISQSSHLWEEYITVKTERLSKSPESQLHHNMTSQDFSKNAEALHYRLRDCILYREEGTILYPELNMTVASFPDSDLFKEAENLEYNAKDYSNALEKYQNILDTKDGTINELNNRYALFGKARCLAKLGRWRDAATAYETVSQLESIFDHSFAQLAIHAKHKAFELRFVNSEYKTKEHSHAAQQIYFISLYGLNIIGGSPDIENKVFLLEKTIEIYKPYLESTLIQLLTEQAQEKLALLKNAVIIADRCPHANELPSWQNGNFYCLPTNDDYYALFLKQERTALLLYTARDLMEYFKACANFFADIPGIQFQVCDLVNGKMLLDTNSSETDAFLSQSLNEPFSEFQVSLYFSDSAIFDNAANRQTTIYIWSGVLVALFILCAGGVSIRAVSRQIQMNRLKNDFIATVTHELKTPLSSMRLLVDTLLEGRYEDKQTVPEYLGLIANENKRLSHLIDSFLTFSRMERNKQVFDFQNVCPKDIASAGAEAARAKLRHGGCNFDMDIDAALPMLRADKDALVTVLVNLLDNACKYSGDDKHICLKVYSQNGEVCFAVTDRGIGISKRVQKKIFQRFYQVDSRLSRSSEGCGLGLSIVQFIVEAHKGTINVESQPGQGSTFTVRLPAV